MAGRITQGTIDAVISGTDLVSLVGEYVSLVQRGSDWWGCCPFHQEKTPSFSVVPDKNMYYCFGCHKGGNAISFVMEMDKLSYPEAIVQLAKRAGIEVAYENGGSPENIKHDNTKEEIINLYERTASMFHYLLTQEPGGKFALDYIKGRGLTDETIAKFKLGYAPADRRWLKKFLRKKNFSDEFLAKTGLFSEKYPDIAFFSDRLMFTIFNRQGQAVAFGGRLLRGEGPKYLNSGDLIQYQKGSTLYAFNFARNAIRLQKKVIFCEGYMDCIAYHQSGLEYAVAPLGTALTEEQVKLVQNFVDTVLLSFDSDGAGQAATRKAILLCRRHGLLVKVIRLRGGKDPAEIMLNYGAKTLTDDVNAAILDSDYLFDVLSHEYPIDTPDGKTKAAQAFFPYIDALQTDIQKESCLDQLGQRFSISPEAVRRDFKNRSQVQSHAVKRPNGDTRQEALIRQSRRIVVTAELRAVLAVVADTNQFELMRAELSETDFENNLARKLFMILEECYRSGDMTFPSILNHCEDDALRQVITESVAAGEYTQDTIPQTVHDSIELIKRNSLGRQRNEIVNRIRALHPGAVEEQQQLQKLLEQKMTIDQKLQRKD
ncbi:MAG: DNA primase [Treponema sp.]|nr:DNA primase [Treponema sp.]